MKKTTGLEWLEKGQILPLVVLGIVALIGMAALILDGAIVMSHRREAQSAADAAALAGAEYLCPPDYDQNLAIAEAANYVGLNHAVLAEPITFPDESTIHVEASIQTASFFAQIINQPQLSATAEAEASCTPLSTGHSTLPVAFPCIIPEEGEPDDCRVKFYNEEETMQWNIENGGMTILMDSLESDLDCYDAETNPTGVICDIDGDGINDVISMAARGWLSLDDNCSTKPLIDWIDGTVTPPDIGYGYWLSNCAAVNAAVYHAVKELVPREFRIPIYNKQCPNAPPSSQCPLLWEAGDNEDLIINGVGHKSYRIVGFGLFTITCVNDKIKDVCPFRDFIENNEGYPAQSNKVKSMEGYFIEGTFPSGGGGGVDFGFYVVHLKK